jgi:putative iron-only hydrogenase system regulator
MEKKRVGVIGIIVENREKVAPGVNELLTMYGDIIVGRMGIPYHERGVSVISLIVDGTTNEIGALTGKLGMIEGVTVKSAMAKGYER